MSCGYALWREGRVLLLVLTGSLIAIVAIVAGYLLGYAEGYAEGRVQWKAVFRELREFDE